jgi:DNA polymerase bacteriophage-type
MELLWIDLETRSQCDLVAHGLMRYAQDPTTQVICMSYAFNGGVVKTWFAEDGPFPQEVLQHILSGGTMYAHNAAFERHLFDYVLSNDYNFKPPKLEQWRCSAARAMAHGLPAALGKICRALALPLQKQAEGTRLIKWYSAPNFKTEWAAEDKQLMQDYCEMDVMTMRQFCSVLRELEDSEWAQYYATERMNDRGVPLQIPFAEAAMRYSEEVKKDVNERIQAHTGGEVRGALARKSRDKWLFERITDEQKKLLVVHKDGVKKYSLDKEHRGHLAAAPNLNPEAARLLELMEEAGGSAVSKYKAMANTHVDGRVYGSLIWNGAGATGRYSSKGLQLQNFRRDVLDDPEPAIADIIAGKVIEKPSVTLGRLVRSAITHSQRLTFSDYSQIEARVLPWLSGSSASAEATLDVFRDGRDIYSETAIGMFDLNSIEDVTKDLRQAAKQGVLACGFGGGAGAVQNMAKGYGLVYTYDKANGIKEAWRKANPWAEPFWYGLKEAAQEAVRQPNTLQRAGRLKLYSDGLDFLWLMLPSGRVIAYLKPRFEFVMMPWGDESYELTCIWGGANPKVGEKWPRRTVSHLILSENATQATAADVMREAMVRAEQAGLPTLFTVHDELVVEGECFDALHDVMVTTPEWAAGLPIDADTQVSDRYGK